MKYVMMSGILYREPNCVIAKLKSVFVGSEKRVYRKDGSLALKTIIRELDAPDAKWTDVRFRNYVMLDTTDKEIAVARPNYAEGDDPSVVGWPICRMPRVDRADLEVQGNKYTLTMQNNKNHVLKNVDGQIIVQIIRRRLTGGWNIDVSERIAPELLCGLIAFCMYMEQENEFLCV